jgi:hypothetical protein
MKRLYPVLLLALLVIGVPRAGASSHSEAPLTAKDRQIDCTDVYAFVHPNAPDAVTIVTNWIPLEEPSGGPNYYGFDDRDAAIYEIKIDNNGDAVEDLTYRFEFSTVTKNPNTFLYTTGPVTFNAGGNTYDGLNVEQRYACARNGAAIVQNALVAPNNVGHKSIPGPLNNPDPAANAAAYAALANAAVQTLADGTRIFCGPRDDAFFIDLGRTFDLVNFNDALGAGGTPFPLNDDIAGFNCHTIALQVPKALLTSDGSPGTDPNNPASIVGIWATSSRRLVRITEPNTVRLNRRNARNLARYRVLSPWIQVSRLGQPLVNEVVMPRRLKDVFNNSEPRNDAQFLDNSVAPNPIQNVELAGALNALFGVNVPPSPRNDIVQIFLLGVPGLTVKPGAAACEYLRLNMAVAPTALGAQDRLAVLAGQLDGYPNGRRLGDDALDISLRVVAGVFADANGNFVAAGSPFNVAPNNALGDGINGNDVPFLPDFPYEAAPHSGTTRAHQ